jgi:hypothetical protein
MSEGEDGGAGRGANEGPHLKLIYGLIFAAIVVAIGVATMIVLPFYQRR